jgi:hypothetical protein
MWVAFDAKGNESSSEKQRIRKRLGMFYKVFFKKRELEQVTNNRQISALKSVKCSVLAKKRTNLIHMIFELATLQPLTMVSIPTKRPKNEDFQY